MAEPSSVASFSSTLFSGFLSSRRVFSLPREGGTQFHLSREKEYAKERKSERRVVVMKKNLRRILQIATGRRDISTYVDVTTFGSGGSGVKSKGSEPCLVVACHYSECDAPVEMRRAAPKQLQDKEGRRRSEDTVVLSLTMMITPR